MSAESKVAAPVGGRDELLPCPFCGNDVQDDEGCFQSAGFRSPATPVFSVVCGNPNCNADTSAATREQAIAAWNRRTTPQPAPSASGGAAPAGGHTPGPWDQRREYDLLRDEIGVRGRAIAVVWVRKADGVLNSERVIRSDAEREANARLIAAAPDLLAALQGVLRVADRKTDEFDAARAAIARATGAAS